MPEQTPLHDLCAQAQRRTTRLAPQASAPACRAETVRLGNEGVIMAAVEIAATRFPFSCLVVSPQGHGDSVTHDYK